MVPTLENLEQVHFLFLLLILLRQNVQLPPPKWAMQEVEANNQDLEAKIDELELDNASLKQKNNQLMLEDRDSKYQVMLRQTGAQNNMTHHWTKYCFSGKGG